MKNFIHDFAIKNANIVELLALEYKNRIIGTTYEINDGKIVAINEKSRRIISSESNS